MTRARATGGWRGLLAFVGLSLLALPGCGGDGEAVADPLRRAPTTSTSTTTTVPTTTTAPPPTFPLSGLPAADPALLSRPALCVKIDNVDSPSQQARPQIGLNQADVVYEVLVEGGITRFLAVFHSTDADPLGPIRSARTSDISIFSPLNRPLFAWSGAADWVIPRVRNAPAIDVSHDAAAPAYRRRGDRRSPHNLYSSTGAFYGFAPAGSTPPPTLFAFRDASAPLAAGARPVAGVDLSFGPGPAAVPVQYRWDPARSGWARTQNGSPHVDEAGVQVAPQNLVVQLVPYGLDSPRIPLAQLEGTGPVLVFTNGHVIEGTWSKAAPDAVTQYAAATGQPIGLTPGRTWVALVPSGGSTRGSAAVV
ncbi:MAG: DUF3048 domain-containing protein [Acidimicrobiales bacterium]